MSTVKFESETIYAPAGCSPERQAEAICEYYKKTYSTDSRLIRGTMGEVIWLRNQHAAAANLYNELAGWQAQQFDKLQEREAAEAEVKASAPQRFHEAFLAINKQGGN